MSTRPKFYAWSATDRDGDVFTVSNTAAGGLQIVSNGENSTAKRPPGTSSHGSVELTPESARRMVAAVFDLRECKTPPTDPHSPALVCPKYPAAPKWLTWGVDGPGDNQRGDLIMILRPNRGVDSLVFAVGANRDTAGSVLAGKQLDEFIAAALALLSGNDPNAVDLGKPLIP